MLGVPAVAAVADGAVPVLDGAGATGAVAAVGAGAGAEVCGLLSSGRDSARDDATGRAAVLLPSWPGGITRRTWPISMRSGFSIWFQRAR